jgi:uncharacterized protein (DUF488 family)
MQTTEFARALAWLIETSRRETTAFMCSETVWWRCHRRMIADALVAAGRDVTHLLDVGKLERHVLHPAVRVDGPRLLYDRT